MNKVFTRHLNPRAGAFGATAVEALKTLDGPTHIILEGKDASRSRAVVTLLHGNEPSGFEAILQILRRGHPPAVTLHLFIVNIEAAKTHPPFSHRNILGERDLNRCFAGSYDDKPGRVAKALLDILTEIAPEAVIDVHNTSGSGPAFGVTTFMDERHDALNRLFTHRMIITDLRLGALMEIGETICPTITMECGGAQDASALQVAQEGLYRFFYDEHVLNGASTNQPMTYFHNPIRLELKDKLESRLSYGFTPGHDGGLVLYPDIERYNFEGIREGQDIGFIAPEAMQELKAISQYGTDTLHNFFESREGKLCAKVPLKLFMITTNIVIARSDCLLYFTAA